MIYLRKCFQTMSNNTNSMDLAESLKGMRIAENVEIIRPKLRGKDVASNISVNFKSIRPKLVMSVTVTPVTKIITIEDDDSDSDDDKSQ